jgi:hypothetical protein
MILSPSKNSQSLSICLSKNHDIRQHSKHIIVGAHARLRETWGGSTVKTNDSSEIRLHPTHRIYQISS